MLYTQLNPLVPILRLCNNPEACLRRDFWLIRQSAALLRRLIYNPRDHGWGQELEILIFLYSLAHGLSLPVVCRTFGVPKPTVHRVIHRVAGEIKAKLGTMVSLPSPDELPNVCQGFCRLAQSPVFSNAAGALDGCHIRIKPPGNVHKADYVNYKLFPSIQMQVISDATGRFLDIFVGYKGSVHDARVLRNSPIYSQALHPPSGFFLLAHGGYPCLEKPSPSSHPTSCLCKDGSRYNRHHSRARSVAERAFGMMKARWSATLFKALEVSPAFAPDIIACCAFLHNLCLNTSDVMELKEIISPDGDLQVPHDDAPEGQETTGSHIRDMDGCFPVCP